MTTRRKLAVSPNRNDETPVVLTADQHAVAAKALQEISGCVSWLGDLLTKGDLNVSRRVIAVGLIESYFGNLAKALGYESDLAAERDHRYAEIRAANEEIDELREQLGQATPVDGIPERLNLMAKEIEDYWHSLGFGLCMVRIAAGCNARFEAELSVMIDHDVSLLSCQPVTDKATKEDRLQAMIDSGLVVHREDKYHAGVVDCEASRKWITDRLVARFPSLSIWNWECCTLGDRKGPNRHAMRIKSLNVMIEFGDVAGGEGR